MLARQVSPSARTPVICGPTAGGKSDLAVALALALRERFGVAAEIIAADAFQVYRGMDVGTAKPTEVERRGVPHHLIDLIDPAAGRWEAGHGQSGGRFTVDDWLRLARGAIADVRARGGQPIVVGGTHLYIKALLDGLFEGPEPDAALRAELGAMNPAVRRAELERVDSAAAARIHPNDVRRTVRALEVYRLTGKPISAHQSQWDKGGAAAGEFVLTILDWEVEALNRRVNARVKSMLERGLVDELRRLTMTGPLAPQPAEALGYKQLLPMLAGNATLEDAVDQIKIETRRFAKNQRTWMRRLRITPGTLSIPMPDTPPEQVTELVMQCLGPAFGPN